LKLLNGVKIQVLAGDIDQGLASTAARWRRIFEHGALPLCCSIRKARYLTL
jgi:hypothetical protein